ncbi:hypothetical protein [Corynebacterium yonathiae]|uniref:Uncharacterized protein n=1 Tax=Corynebacterium yonathiae TaxID=2913504 RepID=A0A9X3LWT2_9CORY|nr:MULTISPECIES: hypothetical protein [Corynebacterium]MCZ9295427.1 hypothetical protein [Corynebacterium yonathiae]MDK2583591.1 hypothetical protein [Corynebacterium sp. BWA136]
MFLLGGQVGKTLKGSDGLAELCIIATQEQVQEVGNTVDDVVPAIPGVNEVVQVGDNVREIYA